MQIKGIDYPEEILQARTAGELVIFAGAGVSKPPPSSLPLFDALAKQIGEGSSLKMGKDEPADHYLGRLKKEHIHVHEAAAKILLNEESRTHPLHLDR